MRNLYSDVLSANRVRRKKMCFEF